MSDNPATWNFEYPFEWDHDSEFFTELINSGCWCNGCILEMRKFLLRHFLLWDFIDGHLWHYLPGKPKVYDHSIMIWGSDDGNI
jgi:hypothetical protein